LLAHPLAYAKIVTNNFENKNLHVANDEVEDFLILEGGKGM